MSHNLDFISSQFWEFNRHAALTLKEICNPLLNNFNITHFNYTKIYDNGCRLYLCNKSDWIERYLMNNFHNHEQHSRIYHLSEGLHYALWAGHPQDDVFATAANFNICHGFSIYDRQSNCAEAYHFGTTRENSCLLNFYVKHLDLLKHFILYFREHAHCLMDDSDKTKLILSKVKYTPKDELRTDSLSVFLEQCQVKKFYIKNQGINLHLSPREHACLTHLNKGLSIKEIGRILEISPRTVETYVNNIKNKTGCHHKSQLRSITLSNFSN